MNITARAPMPPATTTATATEAGGKPGNLHDAASEFESLLLGQMLKSARADSQGWFGTGEDETSSSLIDMAEEHVAKALAQAGGLGLARMVETQMSPPATARHTAPDAAESGRRAGSAYDSTPSSTRAGN